jgi:hypothetical protein
VTTGRLTVTDRGGGIAVRDIGLMFTRELTDLAAYRESFAQGTFYPRADGMTGLLAPIPLDWRYEGAPPPGYRYEDGVADGHGGRVFNIPQNYVARNTIYRCAVVKPASTTTVPQIWNSWVAGNNPDEIMRQRNSRPRLNSSGSVQWSSAALVTNFSSTPIVFEHSDIDPGYWKRHEGAERWATIFTFGCWGALIQLRYCRNQGSCDNYNHAAAPGATATGVIATTHIYRTLQAESFWANQLQPTEFYDVQNNPTDPRGGNTHSDNSQWGTLGKTLYEECELGGDMPRKGAGTDIDPGPIGTRTPCGFNANAMLKDEGDSRYRDTPERTRLRDIKYLRCWMGGSAATVNAYENNGNTLSDGIVLEQVRIRKRGWRDANGVVRNEPGAQVMFSSDRIGVVLNGVVEWDPSQGPFSDTGRAIVPYIKA